MTENEKFKFTCEIIYFSIYASKSLSWNPEH
jgi:hypothetical protein